MSVQAGKFFDVKKTKDYFDGMNISMDEYIKKSEIANAEYLNFFSTDAFRGKTAKAVKMLVKNRAGQMLDDAVKAQNLVKDSQDFTLSTFAAEVDPAPNARIEYNTLRNIETDFKGFHNKFKSIALSVENIADRLNGEFGSYGYFGKPDSRPVLREYENFCGGDADNTGYLSECIGKLVRFDGMVNSYITSKQIDVHSTTVSARAKSVGAALMTPVAKSPKMAKYEIKTISTEPVAKSGGSKTNGQDAKYAELMKEYGFTEEEMEYLKTYYPNLLNTLYSARNSSTRLEMRTYEKIEKVLDTYHKQHKIEDGKVLEFPQSGEIVQYNDGITTYSLPVADEDAWSIEFNYETAKSRFRIIAGRMETLMNRYTNNNGNEDLLKFDVPEFGDCYAGAMVEGYGEVGDIVKVFLEDGSDFNFIVLDVKYTHHSHDELSVGQVQNDDYGHGYLRNNNTSIAINACEFMVAGWKYKDNGDKYYSATEYTSELNLEGNHVTKAQIVGHIDM